MSYAMACMATAYEAAAHNAEMDRQIAKLRELRLALAANQTLTVEQQELLDEVNAKARRRGL